MDIKSRVAWNRAFITSARILRKSPDDGFVTDALMERAATYRDRGVEPIVAADALFMLGAY